MGKMKDRITTQFVIATIIIIWGIIVFNIKTQYEILTVTMILIGFIVFIFGVALIVTSITDIIEWSIELRIERGKDEERYKDD